MCHAEAFRRSFFVFSICLLLFVCGDNCLQIVADNLFLRYFSAVHGNLLLKRIPDNDCKIFSVEDLTIEKY